MDRRTKKRIREQILDGTIYKKKRYSNWRGKVFRRDRYKCQYPGCGKIGGYLQAHHIKMKYKYPELIYNVGNGITLCYGCHQMIHKEGTAGKMARKFRKIIRENSSTRRGK
jgi:5-methylcytosine-specific restriction endonuclease McrA